MELIKELHIHTRLIVIPFRKATTHDLGEIAIADVIFRKQNQVVISVITACQFFIKTGVWRHIDLASDDGSDALSLTCLIEINDAVHDAMVRDGSAVHAKLLDSLYIFFDFIGTVQQTVLCVDVEMGECHDCLPVCLIINIFILTKKDSFENV